MGTGRLMYGNEPLPFPEGDLGCGYRTAPQYDARSELRPYYPAPFGDMMIAGCFGLLAATADLVPETREAIKASLLAKGGSGTPPWEAL
jgi:hypothetical protein